MGYLTTHILDTANGTPAESVNIRLYAIGEGSERILITDTTSNYDGRCDTPILTEQTFEVGTYELEFDIGEYYANKGVELPEPRFLDVVVIRFGINDLESHYHVPLLVSPFSYSTYRGS
ncbi:hydroxyisourate hydrolase [Marinomonas mediterranea]|jgi:hydroxyisourate hydrolase|uniref:5-hydroxyisourate hydrolase n=1 Tax=Marinomonas mediterranea (strain ATCC 700492 / JCM 21426 / NBRC 103028 / MMB-1) TaxID=717774 RepID=F2JXL7_MARM1|nr:hydroxyisourate hydrolase [Marinomonas mediterranea]ADZ93015.1 hydroxyisourate hydrolase [Marinomonas mediterranea MMB-1]WCN10926.1 hydroxyisourate hydrolase [Marinomonas mediterranea]WCN14988.1 hydroxyisourate hydrolase [Marinomonas mediterranea]WCN19032.1 hydroxyisourate hydrolase [Marinomonas mediterranea MMB-1]